MDESLPPPPKRARRNAIRPNSVETDAIREVAMNHILGSVSICEELNPTIEVATSSIGSPETIEKSVALDMNTNSGINTAYTDEEDSEAAVAVNFIESLVQVPESNKKDASPLLPQAEMKESVTSSAVEIDTAQDIATVASIPTAESTE